MTLEAKRPPLRPLVEALAASRWTSAVLLALSAAILVLTLPDLPGGIPALENPSRRSGADRAVLPLKAIEAIASWSPAALAANPPNPFHTTYFQPPPAPPPPKPAATRMLEVVFQGSFQIEGGEARAFVKAGGALLTGGVGSKVGGSWVIGEISNAALVLRNEAGQTNILAFNKPGQIEVPAQ